MYALVLTVFVLHGVSTVYVPFANKQACENAAGKLRAQLVKFDDHRQWTTVHAVCLNTFTGS